MEGPTAESESGREAWFAKPCVMGIDEAGRGPVLGDMVYGCAYCTEEELQRIGEREFADSKKLTEARREDLYEVICRDTTLAWDTESLPATVISQRMLGSVKTSLNVLASEATFALIDRALARGVDLQQVFVDTVGDPKRHEAMLSSRYPSIRFTVCPKADSIYPLVSAASIVAKVTRDRALRQHVHSDAINASTSYGSGYPGDPVTKAWLEAHLDRVFGFPDLVRFSWQTCTRMLEDRAVPVRWECEDSTDGQQATLLTGPSQGSQGASGGAGRHSFFRARQLQPVHTF
ncbi:hypothetical protein WJX73_002697 [Symbiochloris irregularis]|uniref:Ribonuclease n=1 Tax=Symbiochloris irregularis TaxID=706552 RepID=A0AAW1P7E5_9CHLO